MTRINAGIDPVQLADQHCMAEYRELPMVFAALRRSLRTQSSHVVARKIPPSFCLGAGHVTFFYNKLEYLFMRYGDLQSELRIRGYTLTPHRLQEEYADLPARWWTSWTPDPEACRILTVRISERLTARPTWYR